jgi:hypothetical protein
MDHRRRRPQLAPVTQDVALVSSPTRYGGGERIAFTGARDSVDWSENDGGVDFVCSRRGGQDIATLDCASGGYRTRIGGAMCFRSARCRAS